MLGRMAELSTAAADSSKNQDDRANLDLEFQQLKQEVSRISEAGKYNGLAINGKTGVAVWDALKHKVVYSQGDGTDVRELTYDMRAGNSSENGVEYVFEASVNPGHVGNFLFTDDGKELLYLAQADDSNGNASAFKTIMKLNLGSNTLTTVDLDIATDSTHSGQAALIMDDQGRVWVSDSDGAASTFTVKLLNTTLMTLDSGGANSTNKWVGGVTLASSSPDFAVHGDYIYYFAGSGVDRDFTRQSLFDQTDQKVLLDDVTTNYSLDQADTYTVSSDGMYIAFEDINGGQTELVVLNTESGERARLQVGTNVNSIVDLGFDANNNLYWTDTGGVSSRNAIRRAEVVAGDVPELRNITDVRTATAGHFGALGSAIASTHGMGLSVGGGNPASNYRFQIGPDAGQEVEYESADVRLVRLGISRLDVKSIDGAQQAITDIGKAIDKVALQRAVIGSQVSRLGYTLSSNDAYANNIAAAESRLRDVDFAKESSELAQGQIVAQAATSMLAKMNQQRQSILALLQ